MKKTRNILSKAFFGVSYAFVTVHSLIVMYRLISTSDGASEVFDSLAIVLIWSTLLGLGGIYIYSIIVEPSKENKDADSN